MQFVVRHAAQIMIIPTYHDELAYSTTALILRSLTKYLPNRVNTAHNWKHVAVFKLADSDPMNSDRYYRCQSIRHARS